MEGTSRVWLPPLPFARITALVPGVTVLLRLCLCVLVLGLQNVPSLQFSNLVSGRRASFPWITGDPRALGENRHCP